MSNIFKNVTVVGATGNLGPAIIKGLLDANRFNVSALTRAESTSTSKLPSAVNVIKSDYSAQSLESSLKGQDAIVMTLSGFEDLQNLVIESAAKAGVKRIMLSEFGNDMTNPKQVMDVPLYTIKVRILEHTKSVLKSYPQTSYTGLTTGPFLDWGLSHGVFGFDNQKHHAEIYDNGTVEIDTTTLPTIGIAVAGVLSRADKYANEYVFVKSFTTTQNQMLEALKTVTGASWTTENKSALERANRGREGVKAGHPMAAYDMLIGIMLEEGHGQSYSQTHPLSNKDLGLPEEDFLEVVRKAVGA